MALTGALSLPAALFDLNTASAAPTKQSATSEKKAPVKKGVVKKEPSKKSASS